MNKQHQRLAAAMRDHALSLPGATEEFPWGERVVKVDGKVFIFLGKEDGLGFSVKLPVTGSDVLALPHAKPTGYGLGKSGWVSLTFPDAAPPFEALRAWIDESYRAIAKQKRIAELDRVFGATYAERATATTATKKTRSKKAAAKKTTTPKKGTARTASRGETPRR